MTLTLDFQCQILKKTYPRNGMANGHGTKGMWVDRTLDPLCDLEVWPWPKIFKVRYWKSHISGIGWSIDMEWKECESIGSHSHFATLNFDLIHVLNLRFSRSYFQTAISYEWVSRLTRNERDISQCWTHYATLNFDLIQDLSLIFFLFSRSYLK